MPNYDVDGFEFQGTLDLAQRRRLREVLATRVLASLGRELPAVIVACQRPQRCDECYGHGMAVVTMPAYHSDRPRHTCMGHAETYLRTYRATTCSDCHYTWYDGSSRMPGWARRGEVRANTVGRTLSNGSFPVCHNCAGNYAPCSECDRRYNTTTEQQCCVVIPRCNLCNRGEGNGLTHVTDVVVMSRYNFTETETIARVCSDCMSHSVGSCIDCGRHARRSDLYLFAGAEGQFVCTGCVGGYLTTAQRWETCSRHARAFRMGVDEITCCNPYARIHSYSHKPNPVFRGEGDMFYGVEIEISTGDQDATLDAAGRGFRDLFYYKEDGSIRSGFEMVSHPATWDYWTGQVNWGTLGALRDSGAYEHNSCGIHVHASRRGFSGAAHEHKWLAFFDRNQQMIERVARRSGSGYARFRQLTPRDKKRIATTRTGRPGYFQRYSAVNCNNESTYEVRIFATSLDAQTVQAAIGFVSASVEYTRTLKARDAVKANGLDWHAFRMWVESQPQYAILVSEMNRVGA